MQNVDFKDLHNGKEIRNTQINIVIGKDISTKYLFTLISKTIDYKGSIYFNSSKQMTSRKLTDLYKLNNLG